MQTGAGSLLFTERQLWTGTEHPQEQSSPGGPGHEGHPGLGGDGAWAQ